MAPTVKQEERAFHAISGHRALDLLATLRNRHGQSVECLCAPTDLDRWLEVVGLDVPTPATQADLEAARELREILDRVVRSLLADAKPPPRDLRRLNGWGCRRPLAPQIGPHLQPRFVGGAAEALVVVAREAIELLTGEERELIRECAAAPACSRIYLDRSPARSRRWCHMQWCGSSAKMRTYRQRRAAPRQPGRGRSHGHDHHPHG